MSDALVTLPLPADALAGASADLVAAQVYLEEAIHAQYEDECFAALWQVKEWLEWACADYQAAGLGPAAAVCGAVLAQVRGLTQAGTVPGGMSLGDFQSQQLLPLQGALVEIRLEPIAEWAQGQAEAWKGDNLIFWGLLGTGVGILAIAVGIDALERRGKYPRPPHARRVAVTALRYPRK
jgi:hypothetical protein